MSDFVEQCRREWRRLDVPNPLAEEMAADLDSDLREAEAEGVSAEELLGSSAFDPRSFARSWAAERGIIPKPPSQGTRRRPLVLVVFTALAATAVIVSALLLVTGQPEVAVVATRTAGPHLQAPPALPVVPPGPGRQVQQVLHASTATPVEWILLLLAIVALGFAAWLWRSWGRSRPPSVSA
jgi:hypothetical protein